MLGFFDGGWGYNFSSLLISAAGLAATSLGLWYAIVQIKKTKTAADAAKDAAEKTQQQVNRLKMVLDLTELCAHCREILTLLRAKNLQAAVVRLSDLRTGLARARTLPDSDRLQTARKWQSIITQVAMVEGALSTSDDGEQLIACTKKVSEIGDTINSMFSTSAWSE